MSAPSSTQIKPESDADRAAKVVAGRTQPHKRQQSHATRAASKNAAKLTPKSSKPAAKPSKPSKPAGLSEREMQHHVMQRLIQAGADVFASWNDPDVPKRVAGEMIAARLSYCPDAANLWDSRLPKPARLSK
jgi:hypothetical protein